MTESLIGRECGQLVVIEFSHYVHTNAYWLCECKCWRRLTVRQTIILKNGQESCRVCAFVRRRTHGLTDSPEYKVWQMMIDKCHNERSSTYYKYGARGIRVCQRWRRSFGNFIADMGRRPTDDHSIERDDNSGDYTPSNCRWATCTEQQRNKRSNVYVVAFGRRLCLAGWSEINGIPANTIGSRLRRGWLPEDAVSAPVRKTRRSNDYSVAT